jgi:hypothetical protein
MRHADRPGTGVGVEEKAATNFGASLGAKNNPASSVFELKNFQLNNFEVTIDELVLTGFSPADRFHIADAVECELARLLTEKGIPGLGGNSVAMEGLDAGKFKATGGARAHVIGRQAAQLLHRQLSLPRAGKTLTKAGGRKT